MDLNLPALRREIDRIDNNLLQLLQRRIEVARLVIRFKKEMKQDVNVPSREQAILDNLMQRERPLLSSEVIKDIYTRIFIESKRIQTEEKRLIAFQGEHGAFSEMAARQWDAQIVPIPCMEFSDVFQGVREGSYDYGIVPVENTAGGIVTHLNSELRNAESRLYVVGSVEMPMRHCLLVPPPGSMKTPLRRVYSHPAVLAECSTYIENHGLESIPYFDTAGAAKMVAETLPEGAGAIAGNLAARYYNLHTLAEGIGNTSDTRTRFVVVSRTPAAMGNKCSLVFSISDRAGALFSILKLFADADINLTRIDSVPDVGKDFAFFIDFTASVEEPVVKQILAEIEKQAVFYRFLGCYEEA